MRLIKRYPNIPDEDVTTIFQEGYMKGWENARKKAIPIEWLYQKRTLYLENECYMSLMVINEILNWWEKENERETNKHQ